jgi:hypothetical protein
MGPKERKALQDVAGATLNDRFVQGEEEVAAVDEAGAPLRLRCSSR